MLGEQQAAWRAVMILGPSGAGKSDLALRLIAAVPFLRRIPARLIGMGFRPEHVETPVCATDLQAGNRRAV